METRVDPEPVAQRSPAPDDSVLSRIPIHPLLLAVYPVLLLYADNLTDVPFVDAVAPTLAALGITCLIWWALARVLGGRRRGAIVASAFIVPAMLFGVVVEALQPEAVPGRLQELAAPLAGVAVLVLSVSSGLYAASKPRLRPTVTATLNVVSIALIVMAALPILTYRLGVDSNTGVAASAAGEQLTVGAGEAPDIYHLVFDRYGSEASLRSGFDIDNAAFVSWLEGQGFKVADHARANHLKTTLSLASTLSLAPLDELADDVGPEQRDLGPVYERIRRNRAGDMLRDVGYRYTHLGSWYNWTRESDVADSVRGLGAYRSFAQLVLARSILSLGMTPLRSDSELARATAKYQWDELEDIAAEPGPKYVFAHVLLPHPPFVYLADGTYAPDEATFETQLRYTNARIKAFVGGLLEAPPDARPIIILQADEGPYPERFAKDAESFDWAGASPDELVTKFGVLNAMYLPGAEGEAPLRSDLSLVNTYPEVFRRYFGAAMVDHPDSSFASPEGRPYDLIDVTDELERAFQ